MIPNRLQTPDGAPPELRVIRRVIGTIFVGGSIGTGLELILLDHVEGAWQKVPLVLVGVSVVALVMLTIRPARLNLRIYQLTMWLFVLSGIAGVGLHLQGNVAFELELNPEAQGWQLAWESLKGATPSLAPGAMTLLGEVGLIYAYRYPAR